MKPKKAAKPETPDFDAIDAILETDGTGRSIVRKKATAATDKVPYLMASNIKDFDVDSQFDITNQRMLAVRDDLMQMINANNGRLAESLREPIAGLKDRLRTQDQVRDKQHAEIMESLREGFMLIEYRLRLLETPWWTKIWTKMLSTANSVANYGRK